MNTKEPKEYDNKFYGGVNSILEIENNRLRSIIKDLKVKEKQCLDFGCGTGYWVEFFLKQGARIIGVDISNEAIKYCKDNYSKSDFVLIKNTTLPFEDSFFDIVAVNWVFQEITDSALFQKNLAEIKRVLKSNGCLVVVDNIYPNRRMLYAKTDMGDLFKNNGSSPLLRFFANNSVDKILKNYGFKQINRILDGHSFFEIYKLIL